MSDPAWESSIPSALKHDVLWKTEAYRLATFVADTAWDDVTQLARDFRTRATADQLQRALTSIGANIAEGFGKRSGKERSHYYESALGSAREARHHYFCSRHLLGSERVTERLRSLNEIVFLLLKAIPRERSRNLA